MPAKKKFEVEVEVTEQPAEEIDRPILVAEAEPEPATPPVVTSPAGTETVPSPPASQIFGPTVAEPPTPNKTLFWALIVVFTLLGAVAGGAGIYLQNRRAVSVVIPSPTPAATASPTPTPAVELNREGLAVQVLNGGGVTGAAADAAEFLEGLGYANVATGNAGSSDFVTTQIAIKNSKKVNLPMLEQDLSEKYTLADKTESLDEDSQYDVVITLGKE